jgi:hypothetical protein
MVNITIEPSHFSTRQQNENPDGNVLTKESSSEQTQTDFLRGGNFV